MQSHDMYAQPRYQVVRNLDTHGSAIVNGSGSGFEGINFPLERFLICDSSTINRAQWGNETTTNNISSNSTYTCNATYAVGSILGTTSGMGFRLIETTLQDYRTKLADFHKNINSIQESLGKDFEVILSDHLEDLYEYN
jgi:hypothetical protein